VHVVVKKLSPAEVDILAAAGWYDDHEPGLGEDFIREADEVIASLAHSALLHPIRFADVRRAGLRRFAKYGVFYFLHENQAVVISVFHGARHPRWLRRRRSEVA